MSVVKQLELVHTDAAALQPPVLGHGPVEAGGSTHAAALTVGYASHDFWRHPTGWMMAGALWSHNRSRVTSVCYHYGNVEPDVDVAIAMANTHDNATIDPSAIVDITPTTRQWQLCGLADDCDNSSTRNGGAVNTTGCAGDHGLGGCVNGVTDWDVGGPADLLSASFSFTTILARAADRFFVVSRHRDQDVTQHMVNTARLDVIVDLMGHTRGQAFDGVVCPRGISIRFPVSLSTCCQRQEFLDCGG